AGRAISETKRRRCPGCSRKNQPGVRAERAGHVANGTPGRSTAARLGRAPQPGDGGLEQPDQTVGERQFTLVFGPYAAVAGSLIRPEEWAAQPGRRQRTRRADPAATGTNDEGRGTRYRRSEEIDGGVAALLSRKRGTGQKTGKGGSDQRRCLANGS